VWTHHYCLLFFDMKWCERALFISLLSEKQLSGLWICEHTTSLTIEWSSLSCRLVLGYLNWQGLKTLANDKNLWCSTVQIWQVTVVWTVSSDVYADLQTDRLVLLFSPAWDEKYAGLWNVCYHQYHIVVQNLFNAQDFLQCALQLYEHTKAERRGKTFHFSYLETYGSEFKQADFMYNALKQRKLNVLSFKKKKNDRVCQNLEAALTLAYCCGHLSLLMSGLVLLLQQSIKCLGTLLIVSLHFLAASICMTNVLQGPVL